MQTQIEVVEDHPQIFEVDYLQQEMSLDWTAEDARQLAQCL
jgi:hypothetical protein